MLKWVEIKGSPDQKAHVYIFLKVKLKSHQSDHRPLRQGQLLFQKQIEMEKKKKEINHNCLSCRGSNFKKPNWSKAENTPKMYISCCWWAISLLLVETFKITFSPIFQIRVRMMVSTKAKKMICHPFRNQDNRMLRWFFPKESILSPIFPMKVILFQGRRNFQNKYITNLSNKGEGVKKFTPSIFEMTVIEHNMKRVKNNLPPWFSIKAGEISKITVAYIYFYHPVTQISVMINKSESNLKRKKKLSYWLIHVRK